METYNEFKQLMQEYNSLLDKILNIENGKVKIIAEDDIEKLEAHMRMEEAEVLRMKGLDRRREVLLENMGHKGKTFKQIIELSAAEQKSELQPLCAQMGEKTERLKELSASISRMLESKMIRLENTEWRMRNQAGKKVYNQNGERIQPDNKSRMKPTSV